MVIVTFKKLSLEYGLVWVVILISLIERTHLFARFTLPDNRGRLNPDPRPQTLVPVVKNGVENQIDHAERTRRRERPEHKPSEGHCAGGTNDPIGDSFHHGTEDARRPAPFSDGRGSRDMHL